MSTTQTHKPSETPRTAAVLAARFEGRQTLTSLADLASQLELELTKARRQLALAEESKQVFATDCAVLHQRNEEAKAEIIKQARETNDLRRQLTDSEALREALKELTDSVQAMIPSAHDAAPSAREESVMRKRRSWALNGARNALSAPAPEVVSKAEMEEFVRIFRWEARGMDSCPKTKDHRVLFTERGAIFTYCFWNDNPIAEGWFRWNGQAVVSVPTALYGEVCGWLPMPTALRPSDIQTTRKAQHA